MTSVAAGPIGARPLSGACGQCRFAVCEDPGRLTRILTGTAVRFERAIWAAHTAGLPSDDVGRCILDQVVQVRDTLHGYANRLGRLAEYDTPVFADEHHVGAVRAA